MKLKSLKQLVAATAVVLTVSAGIMTNVSAMNNRDTSWSWKTFGDRGTRYTDAREKQDSSPAYSNVLSYKGRSDDYLQMYLVDSNKSDFHKRIVKTISKTGKYSVSSYAYEDRGVIDVRMAFYAPYRFTYSWSANGLWSPDSAGRYN